jgi:phosphate/sulfate permease
MGGSNFSPAFSAALGARLVPRAVAIVLFVICVSIGAFFIGGHVAKTLGDGLLPAGTLDKHTALVVIVGATGALFVAHLAKIPESTSWVTVFAISCVGITRSNLNWHTIFYKVLPGWIVGPPIAFCLTFLVMRRLYPLGGWNYRLYEHLTKHEWKLRALVIASSCYLAIAVGANSVANVVAPLSSAGVFSIDSGMLLFAPVFALGGLVFFRTAKTVGGDVVPLGLYSATIINVVVATVILMIAWLGIPQSVVHSQVMSVIAIALAKEGAHEVIRHRMIRRIAMFWLVSPMIASTLVALQLALLP